MTPPRIPTAHCTKCGAKFEVRKPWHRFCCATCRFDYNNHERAELVRLGRQVLSAQASSIAASS